MKLLPVLMSFSLIVVLSNPASAAKKKAHHASPAEESGAEPSEDDSARASGGKPTAAEKPAATEGEAQKPPLDFDFFGGQPGAAGESKTDAGNVGEADDLAAKAQTRRWMLKTHQVLGILTWLSMVATVTVGQLNYNELYGGGGHNTWQTPHRALVISTSTLFAAAATFSIFAPTPYKKPLHLDTGFIHRVAVIGATLGMVTEGVLGWITTHQADAGNPHNLRTMARTHQIVGYTTLGFLTIAGTVWIF
jgi:hypothetical protein